ncbi:MAG: reverse transcriptase domain-containing protein [Christensenellaceae bacterium]
MINQKYNLYAEKMGIGHVSIAYRGNLKKNNIDFAKIAFDTIKEKKECFIVISDFEHFFDNLNHQYLKEKLCQLLEVDYLPDDYYAVYKNITKYSSWKWKDFVEKSGHKITTPGIRKLINQKKVILSKADFDLHKNNIEKNPHPYGIPQGSPISAILANVYMIDFDQTLNHYIKSKNGLYLRYSDDIIIIMPYQKSDEIDLCFNTLSSAVQNIPDLSMQADKTSIYTFKEETVYSYKENIPSSIDYLGFVFNGKEIKLRPKSITKYYYRM